MKKKDIVFHKNSFGLGFVRDLNKDELIIKFIDNKENKFVNDDNNPFLNKVDKFTIDYLSKISNFNFSSSLKTKGKNYYLDGAVSNITYKDTEIFAIVSGTYDYHVSINITPRGINYRCTCPVKGVCKHVCATIYKANAEVGRLNNLINNNYDIQESLIDMDSVDQIISFDKDFSSYIGFYNQDREFKTKYSNNIIQYLYQLELYSKEDPTKIRDVLWMLIANRYINSSVIGNYINNRCNSYEMKYIYKELSSKVNYMERLYYIPKSDLDLAIKYFIVNNRYENLFRQVFRFDNPEPVISFIIDADIIVEYNLKELFLEQIKHYQINDKLFLYLYKILTEDEFFTYISEENYTGLKPETLLTIYKKEELLDLSFKIVNENLIDYICDNIDFYCQYNKFRTILTLIYRYEDCKIKVQKKIKEKIKEKENTKYIYAYFEREINEFYKNPIDFNEILKYFQFNYKISIRDNELIVEKVFSMFDDVLLIIEGNYSNGKIEYVFGFDKLETNDVHLFLEQGIIRSYGEKYMAEIEAIETKLKEKNKQKMIAEQKQTLKDFEDRLSPETIYLSKDALIDIEFSLEKYTNNHYTLSLKVGNIKKYIVKNIYSFLINIENNQMVEYGKSLAFSHNLDNFKEEYRDSLEYLININNYQFNFKEAKISNKDVGILIKKLINNKIRINNKDYTIRLNKIDYQIDINKNYEIQTKYNNYTVYYFDNLTLLFDEDNQVIDYLTNIKNERLLIEFSEKYKNNSIEYIIEDFKEKIYIYFQDKINICDELKDTFKLKDIKIKSYFDYTNKVITVKTEITSLEDKILNIDKLSKNERIKYRKYLNYLYTIGFENNKIEDSGKIINFFTMDFNDLRKLSEVYLSDSITNKTIETFSKQTVVLTQKSTVMEAVVEESIYSNEELYEILKAIKLKKKYVLLKNNKIITLDNEEANEFYELVDDLKIDKKKVLSHQAIPIYQSLKAYAHLNNCKIDDYLLNMINEISNFKNYDIEIPKVNVSLREYQKEGFKWLKILSKYHLGGILADDMGLGKTLQIITLLKSDTTLKPSLIVCPKTLIFNWVSEFLKFDEKTKVVEIYGNSNVRKSIISNINYDENIVYITSYDSLRSDVELYNKEFKYFILDEAQVIKNVYAGKSQAVKNIKSEYKFALTGTPVENNIIDLWSIFDFIMPSYFEELQEFKSLYTSNNDFVSKVSKRIAPFILRRTKNSVLKDLPNKYERIITVSMEKEQQKIYDSFKLQAQNVLALTGKAFDVLPYLLRLRQTCIDPSIIIEDYQGSSAKMKVLEEIICDYIENDHKILIFSQFVKALNIVKKYLDAKDIKYYYLTGDTDALDRIKYSNDFNAKDDIKIFLISLKAGGTGLNLIGADTVIHLDPWWNQAVEQQATDRTYRIGQQRNVEVIKIIAEDSIEKRVIELQNLKKDLIDKLISNDDSSITKLTGEDLKYILK